MSPRAAWRAHWQAAAALLNVVRLCTLPPCVRRSQVLACGRQPTRVRQARDDAGYREALAGFQLALTVDPVRTGPSRLPARGMACAALAQRTEKRRFIRENVARPS